MAYSLECKGWGRVPARIMFVGISAGRRGALVSKVPLTKDASGRLFQRCLLRLGLNESGEFSERPILRCYTTNLVKGRCLTSDGLNRLPTEAEVNYWWPYLEQEIAKVHPRRIVALGQFVWQNLYERGLKNPLLVMVNHPRYYNSHGALGGSPAFEDMVVAYRAAVTMKLDKT